MCLTTRRDPPKWEYVFCQEIPEEVESYPYLGVVLDNKMRWSPHIETITSRANKALGLIKGNLWNCPKSVKETLMSSVCNVNISQTMSARADSTNYIACLHTMHTLLYIYGGIQSCHYRNRVYNTCETKTTVCLVAHGTHTTRKIKPLSIGNSGKQPALSLQIMIEQRA